MTTTPPAHMPLFITSSNAPQHPSMLYAPLSPLSPLSPVPNMHHEWDTPSTDQSSMPLSNNLLFITGTTPADFKSKTNMTRIRKKAMGSYLTKEKKPNDSQRDDELSAGLIETNENMTRRASSTTEKDSHTSSPAATTITNPAETTTAAAKSKSDVSPIAKVPAEFILPSAPIVIPMRNTPYLIYNSYILGPFQSIGKPLDPFATIHQASHPKVSVESLKHYCSRSFGTRAMGVHWIPAVVDSPHAFLSTLCIASAHLDAIQGRAIESVQTLALRQEVMHLISQSLVNPQSRTDDFNIIALIQLITSDMIASQDTALSFHEAGMEVMITQRGGLKQLNSKTRIAPVVTWVMLESALLQEKVPRTMYSQYAASHCTKPHPSTATIPESPLYCPRGEYETLKRSSAGVMPRMLDLLRDVRMMIDLFLHETKQSRQHSLSLKNIYKKITEQYPTAAEIRKTKTLTVDDWRYEAARIASTITATAIIRRVPLSEAVHLAAGSENTQATPPIPQPPVGFPVASPPEIRHDSPTTTSFTHPTYSPSSLSPLHLPSDPPSSTTPTHTLLSDLKSALESSNLSQCWSELGGVLLWIALVVGAASRQSDMVLKKWYRALVVRVSIVLCFDHPEAMLATLLRMGEVMEEVGNATARVEGAMEKGGKARSGAQQSGNKRRRI